VFLLLFLYRIAFSFNPDSILFTIENILSKRSDKLWVVLVNGQLDDRDNLWLSWEEWDRMPKSTEEWHRLPPGTKFYMYWYVQKFNSFGEPAFDAIQVAKREAPYGVVAGIFLGKHDDVFAFPAACRIERIDNEGNRFSSEKTHGLTATNMFIDPYGMMYVIGHNSGSSSSSNAVRAGHSAYLKFKLTDSLPLFIKKNNLPQWPEPDYETYNWQHSNLIYCDSAGEYALFVLPPILRSIPLTDTSKIDIFKVKLPELITLEKSNFKVSDALHCIITGCRYKDKILVNGLGDTLLLYLSNRGVSDTLVYVCKLTQEGKPIKQNNEIIYQQAKNFKGIPDDVSKKISFIGSVTNSLSEPKGILIYGFDKLGKLYYHVWQGSDNYYKIWSN
jgi:hypothetical protein